MKDDCRVSYRRLSSRPKYVENSNLLQSRALFCTKFLMSLNSNTLIINVDESIINRNLKLNYSWGIKGVEKECQNEFVTKSINLILALLSNVTWIWLLWNETIN